MDYQLIHNEASHRFEMDIDGKTAFVDYKLKDTDVLVILHTEVPPELGGRGIASMLIEKMLNFIEEKGWKIIPICPFTVAYIKKHPEWERIVV